MLESVGKTDAREHGTGAFTGRRVAFQFQRQHDVFQRRETADQMKGLEHETDMGTAQFGTLVFVQGRERMAEDLDIAMARGIESSQQPEQGRFARARHTRDGDPFASLKAKIDIIEYANRTLRTNDFLT